MTHDERKGVSPILQYLLAPLIVGIIVLIGQSVLQPYVAEKSRSRSERWNSKREAYVNAIALVDKQFLSKGFNIGPDAPRDQVVLGPEPTPDEINGCYRELVMYSENREIIQGFLRCFGASKDQQTVWHGDKIKLIQLMRQDLGFETIDLKSEDVKLFMRKSKPQIAP